jgi:hypothetical protein
MTSNSLRILRGVSLVLCFWLVVSKSGLAEAASPPVNSPHRLVITVDRAYSSTKSFVSGDRYQIYDRHGDYYGPSISYLYRSLPWLEFGGRVNYGGSNFLVREQLFVGGLLRGALPLGQNRQFELGLTVSAGMLSLLVPDIYNVDNRTPEGDHYFLGVSASVEPDVRWWFTPSTALSFAGQAAIGTVRDVVDAKGLFLDDKGRTVKLGGSLGFVVVL